MIISIQGRRPPPVLSCEWQVVLDCHDFFFKKINRLIIINRSLICSFVRSFARLFVRSFVRLVVRSLVRSFGRSLVRLFVRSLVRSFIRLFPRYLARSLVRLFVRSFARSLATSFVRSFVLSLLHAVIDFFRSFICLFVFILNPTSHCSSTISYGLFFPIFPTFYPLCIVLTSSLCDLFSISSS